MVLPVRIVLSCLALAIAVGLGLRLKLAPFQGGKTWTPATATKLGLAPFQFLVVPACLVAAALVGSGCNILSIPFYLFAPEDKIAPKMQCLADKNRVVKVLIWTWSDRNAFNLEIPSADRMLAQKLEEKLKEGF